MEKQEIVKIIEDVADTFLKENIDEDTSFAFKKKGTAGQVGYEWAIQDMRDKLLTLLD